MKFDLLQPEKKTKRYRSSWCCCRCSFRPSFSSSSPASSSPTTRSPPSATSWPCTSTSGHGWGLPASGADICFFNGMCIFGHLRYFSLTKQTIQRFCECNFHLFIYADTACSPAKPSSRRSISSRSSSRFSRGTTCPICAGVPCSAPGRRSGPTSSSPPWSPAR